jgi:hypothetical protein
MGSKWQGSLVTLLEILIVAGDLFATVDLCERGELIVQQQN